MKSSRLTHLLRGLSAAEREIWEFTKDHPSNCDCRVCDAWHAALRAKRDVSRPGSDINALVGAEPALPEKSRGGGRVTTIAVNLEAEQTVLGREPSTMGI